MKTSEKQELIYIASGHKTWGKDIIKRVYGIGDKEYTLISAQLGLSNNQGRGVTDFERNKIDNYIKGRMKYTALPNPTPVSQPSGGSNLRLVNIHVKPIEQNLRAVKNSTLLNLQNIKTYKGIRHRKGLPVNGQRTKTNAVTARRIK